MSATRFRLQCTILCSLVVAGTACEDGGEGTGSSVEAVTLGEPSLIIGADDAREGHALYRASLAAMSGDGRLVVGNTGTNEVRVYSGTGELLRSFSKQGRGPGEHEYMAGLWLAGDTVIVFDALAQKLSYWSLEGELHLEATLSKGRYDVVGRLADGQFVTTRADPHVDFPAGTSHQDSLSVAILDPHTGSSRPVARVPMQTRFAATLPDGRTIFTPLPLNPRLSIATEPNSIIIGYPSEPTVQRYTAGGAELQPVSLPLSRALLTPEVRRAWQSSVEDGVSDEEKPLMARYLESLPYPDELPAYDRLVASSPDQLWVRHFAVPGQDSTTWTLVENGDATVQLRTPSTTEFLAADAGRIIASTAREDGAEQIVVWSLDN